MASRRDLMARWCDGDATAARALYDRCAPIVYGQLRAVTRDDVLAADLLQQTFLRMCRSRAAYIDGADPLPWLEAIALGALADLDRRR
jgi:DNA-directed RNA polymerase specialized sigma24 family protein